MADACDRQGQRGALARLPSALPRAAAICSPRGPRAARRLHACGYALVVVGFAAKLGVVPLQAWIPVGYRAARGPTGR